MKFIEKREKWSTNITYTGKRINFIFTIHKRDCDDFYSVSATHTKKDIRYNSLDKYNTFETLEQAKLFCERFSCTYVVCFGKDA